MFVLPLKIDTQNGSKSAFKETVVNHVRLQVRSFQSVMDLRAKGFLSFLKKYFNCSRLLDFQCYYVLVQTH